MPAFYPETDGFLGEDIYFPSHFDSRSLKTRIAVRLPPFQRHGQFQFNSITDVPRRLTLASTPSLSAKPSITSKESTFVSSRPIFSIGRFNTVFMRAFSWSVFAPIGRRLIWRN